ncbi:bifunctional 4-hydroxy-2-oxoglutarate aldolase/2-dehydro-3-deoxy-phosphogluconate aldolase [Parapedobacter lycopersici]|uniref:bifunctional 4-hydroxy-2-oxoglutarate aldolase/2-dehydro-3-deoxy-phosphogluconate aldolase n=1 Tax=Parapedobacter lycopersici TaxID=1864939 RepID=UPI00214D6035|nr:bifunctional 4-hydroxy-2-oxoglutarate aldolase/2-dehydro-3-deoxy-phosphogluconate aldolase [Parapedobacter lycopersici]
MDNKAFNWPRFNQVPIVGIIRNLSLAQVRMVLPLYVEAGLNTVEISLTTPDALHIIEEANTRFGAQLNIGAGTVCDMDELQRSLDAGSTFIVSPITDAQLIKSCADRGIPVFPGAFTPTEIYQAWKAGATMVKIFPASLGAQYIKDIKAPFPDIKLLPTGGVGLDNLADFVAAGAEGFGIASQLFDKQAIAANDQKALLNHFMQYARFFQR